MDELCAGEYSDMMRLLETRKLLDDPVASNTVMRGAANFVLQKGYITLNGIITV